MSPPPEEDAFEGGVDPDVARFVSELLGGTGVPLVPSDLRAQRAAAERSRETWNRGGPVMLRRRDFVVGSGASRVGVRLLEARRDSGRSPVLVYVHGGGFTLFSLETHDRLMREYSARSGVAVVGVDYALSPEAKFPIALHQVVAAIDWVVESGPALGLDTDRIAIGGDSAGANLALSACLLLRDRGDGDRISAMLLNYGFFDADFTTASHRLHGGSGKLLTTGELEAYLENYLGGTPHRVDPLALPALAELHDLPASLHVIAECDPLADGDRATAERLQAAGNVVECRVYAGATHSFLEAVSISALADRALAESADWLRSALGVQDRVEDERAS